VSGRMRVTSGTGDATVEAITLLNEREAPVEHVNVGEQVELRIAVRIRRDIPRLVLGYMIKDRLGQPVFGTNTHHTGQVLEEVREGQLIEYRARFAMNLGPGSYSVSTALVSSDTHLVNNYEWRDLAMLFTVSNMDKSYFIGTSWMQPTIEVLA
jgi:lipopolysaccharide transport system ATP-binding protein